LIGWVIRKTGEFEFRFGFIWGIYLMLLSNTILENYGLAVFPLGSTLMVGSWLTRGAMALMSLFIVILTVKVWHNEGKE
jgi:hypothetical protein